MNHPPDEPRMLTRAALVRRGWSTAMIARWLDPADVLRPNPMYSSAHPMRLYRVDRAEEVESRPEFAERSALARERGRRRREITARRRAAAAERLRTVRIDVPAMPMERLATRAVEHWNRRQRDRCYLVPGAETRVARVGCVDAATLCRWEVNYLRHMLTQYDRLLSRVTGQIGREEARRLVRGRVYDAIAESYPWLGAECRRQRGEPAVGHER
ncbi:MAG TPA: hypothetical protein VE172_19970 [Stackebrandtia sp.]|uniref:hypothetical protein n=1 Tax=Stackebrandtia sp. TaxID=2023065 RepID=UPI002D5032D5|nr:hypothetical protein [Stackebrandtia sp.]HZE41082.1 hypothetical protein [Stackebrandtia sp.]